MASHDAGIRRLVLASGSPRRQQLFSLLGLPFVIKAAGVDEHPLDGESPLELVRRVSRAKALAVREVRPDELVIAADTVVALENEVLGKPEDPDHARLMLRRLRGRSHWVYTGLFVWHSASRASVGRVGESLVWMRDYTDEELERYVASGDPMDKAGAYAIQHPEFDPVARVEGCWLNVVGLPLCHLGRALAQFGLPLPSDMPGTCRAFNARDCLVSAEILR
jgi:MAF protein